MAALVTVPPVVVTATVWDVAGVWLGTTAVRMVPEAFTETLVAAVPPTVTVVAPLMKPVPVSVIVVPPRAGPLVGEIPVVAVRVGWAAIEYVALASRVLVVVLVPS